MGVMRTEAAQDDILSPVGFSRFYRREVSSVYGYVLRLAGGDVATAEDLTQETFIALARELKRGNTAAADGRWLVTVARNRFLDHMRREARHSRRLRLASSGMTVDVAPLRSDVLDLVVELDPIHRAVLMMRYVDELPVETIARDIGRSLPATYSLLARARAELRGTKGMRR
jgi:RNA polymerase sigma-70 factor (ECF subfamily)